MDLSICIITLNAREYLRACLESIQRYNPALNYEIIVADNASTDGTAEMLAQNFPQVRLIQNEENLGFTQPVNKMLAVAQGDFFVLLNPDTQLVEDVFTPLVAYLRANLEVGIAIPKVLNADGSFQAQSRRGEARPVEVFGYKNHEPIVDVRTVVGRVFSERDNLADWDLPVTVVG